MHTHTNTCTHATHTHTHTHTYTHTYTVTHHSADITFTMVMSLHDPLYSGSFAPDLVDLSILIQSSPLPGQPGRISVIVMMKHKILFLKNHQNILILTIKLYRGS